MQSTYNDIAVTIPTIKTKDRGERKTYLKIVLQWATLSPSVTSLFDVSIPHWPRGVNICCLTTFSATV